MSAIKITVMQTVLNWSWLWLLIAVIMIAFAIRQLCVDSAEVDNWWEYWWKALWKTMIV